MRRKQAWLLVFLGAVCAAPAGAAVAPQDGQEKKQEEKKQEQKKAQQSSGKSGTKAVPALPLLGGSAPQEKPGENPAQTIIREYGEADQAVITRWREARTEGASEEELQEILRARPDAAAYVERLRAVAQEHKGTDTAFDALLFILQRERDTAARNQLLHDLLQGHRQSPRMAELVPMLQRGVEAEVAVPALRALRESPHREVKALATYVLALRLGEDEATGAEAEQLLELCFEQFADVPYRGRMLGEVAGGALFEQRHLSIGKVAPDIEGNDTDGVAFQLSDYRGKVILLDFWGHW